ncbi:MAG TPA: DUF4384 domain-containing protein [Terriglobales bacterium]
MTNSVYLETDGRTDDFPSGGRRIRSSLSVVFLAILSVSLFAQDDTTRRIVPQEFVQARHGKSSAGATAKYKVISSDGKLPAAGNGSEVRQLGVTVWRLRPAVKTDTGARLLVQEGADSTEWTPERVAANATLTEGDRVRVSIESPQTGYLYVIDRERYADKQLGDPYLIFPTSRVRNGDNAVTAGRLIELPSQDDQPNFFTLRSTKPGESGELLTLLVTEKPIEGLNIGAKPLALTEEQVSEWQKKWGKPVQELEMVGGVGKTWTKAEQQAGADQTRLLTQDEPGPQTIYQVVTGTQDPVLVTVGLKYREPATKKTQQAAK